jgi:hypothetical protein
MTAENIAAQLREDMRAVQVPATMPDYDLHRMRRALINAKCERTRTTEANSFEATLSAALDAIVAMEDAETEAKRAVMDLTLIQAQLTHNAAKVREALRVALAACGDPGAAIAESKHHRATLRANGARAVEISDEKALPDDCFVIKRQPDKAFIKSRLTRGEEIPGAALTQSPPSLVITAKEQ